MNKTEFKDKMADLRADVFETNETKEAVYGRCLDLAYNLYNNNQELREFVDHELPNKAEYVKLAFIGGSILTGGRDNGKSKGR